MNKLLISTIALALLILTPPLAKAGETAFGGSVTPAQRHADAQRGAKQHGKHDGRGYYRPEYRRNAGSNQYNNRSRSKNYRYGRRHVTTRDDSYSSNDNYVYRPLPSRYSQYYRRGARYHYPYYHRDGIWISRYGLTIWLGFDD